MKNIYLLLSLFLFCISISVAQNHAPTAVNDTAATFRGHIKLNVISNDYDIDGNSYFIYGLIGAGPKHGKAIKINDSIIEYASNPSFTGGVDSFSYRLHDNGNPQMWCNAKVYLTVDNSYTLDSVNINNLNAGFSANGILFWESPVAPYPK